MSPLTKMTTKPTHFLNSQLGMILHFRGCITELVRGNVDSDPNCRNPNWSRAKPRGVLRQQKMPRAATLQSRFLSCSDLARGSSSHFSDLCSARAISHLDKKPLETWSSKSPSALSRRSKHLYRNDKPRFIMMTQSLPGTEKAFKWKKSESCLIY